MCGCINNKTDSQKIASRNAILLEFGKFESIEKYDLYGIQINKNRSKQSD